MSLVELPHLTAFALAPWWRLLARVAEHRLALVLKKQGTGRCLPA